MSAQICIACDVEHPPTELAPFSDATGGTSYVCLNLGSCLAAIAAGIPPVAADAPPVAFAATRVRADRLADATGRPRPNLGEPRRSAVGEDGAVSVWHWADPDV